MTNAAHRPIEALLRRDYLVTRAGLAAITLLAWAALYLTTEAMAPMADMAAPGVMSMAWSPTHAALVFLMWVVMMIAMMTPSAAPFILLYARAYRRRGAPTAVSEPPIGRFYAGYIAAWILFSAAATLVQWILERAALLSPTLLAASPRLAGLLLIAVGLYQWSPLKAACLSHCRSPIDHLARHWRNGPAGAFRMGAHHGLYCIGCCWGLMALLFVGGVMSLLLAAVIALIVLVEKAFPLGPAFSRAVAVILLAAGALLTILGALPML